jgi:hypothetical protein
MTMRPLDRDYPTGCLAVLGMLLVFSPLYLEVSGGTALWLHGSGYLVFALTLGPLILFGGVGLRRWFDAHAPRVAPWLALVLLGWANTLLGHLVFPAPAPTPSTVLAIGVAASLLGALVCLVVAVRGGWIWLRRWSRRAGRAGALSR